MGGPRGPPICYRAIADEEDRKGRQVTDERWILRTKLAPEEINGRLELLVSGEGARLLLAKRGAAPRVAGTKVAPDGIAIARTSSARVSVSWDVYPPRLAGTIRSGEFILFPASTTTPELSGALFPDSDETRIALRVRGLSIAGAMVAVGAIFAAFVWIVAAVSLFADSKPADFRWDLVIPCILIPAPIAVAAAVWRQVRQTNRQLVELLCEALDANIVSGSPPL